MPRFECSACTCSQYTLTTVQSATCTYQVADDGIAEEKPLDIGVIENTCTDNWITCEKCGTKFVCNIVRKDDRWVVQEIKYIILKLDI